MTQSGRTLSTNHCIVVDHVFFNVKLGPAASSLHVAKKMAESTGNPRKQFVLFI